jgi:two-component system chemotaxis response regulator CheY
MESRRPRILVVDDNYATQILLKIVLGSVGYELDMASNSSQGIDYLRSRPTPSLVILDLRMPDGGGVDFLEKRSHSRDLSNIPVMILSGDSAITDVASNFGIEHYLVKGAKPSVLIDLVRRLVPANEAYPC